LHAIRFDEPRCISKGPGFGMMPNCLIRQFIRLKPGSSALMQFNNFKFRVLVEAVAQECGKQLVIAIPLPVLVERNQKQIGLVQ
jgi:hypothetical protein